MCGSATEATEVEHLPEGGQHHRRTNQPRFVAGLPLIRHDRVRFRERCVALIFSNASTAKRHAALKSITTSLSTEALDLMRLHLLLPSAAERLVELDECEPLVELCLGKIQFGREIVRFARQHLEVACTAVLIEDI